MIGQAEAVAPGEGIELPHRQCDQYDEGQHDQEEGLVFHDVLGGISCLFLRPTTDMTQEGRIDDMADTTFRLSVSRTTSA